MPVTFNVRHLEDDDLHFKGEVSAEELDIQGLDELIHVRKPLHYDLQVEKMEKSMLVQGRLDVRLDCECVRCLKAFEHRLLLPDWACHLALEGEEPVVISNDVVDLTPYIREDFVLALPQHPLCSPECTGLEQPKKGSAAVATQH